MPTEQPPRPARFAASPPATLSATAVVAITAASLLLLLPFPFLVLWKNFARAIERKSEPRQTRTSESPIFVLRGRETTGFPLRTAAWFSRGRVSISIPGRGGRSDSAPFSLLLPPSRLPLPPTTLLPPSLLPPSHRAPSFHVLPSAPRRRAYLRRIIRDAFWNGQSRRRFDQRASQINANFRANATLPRKV